MDILEEIKTDLERERFARLWERYGYILAVVVIVIVLGTAATVWWKSKVLERQELVGNQFEQALVTARKNQTTEALALFDSLASQSKEGAGMMALLNKASILLKQGKQEEAIKIYDQIGVEKGREPALQQLAQLLGAYLRIEAGAEPDKASSVLDSLSQEGGIWRASALELKAMYLLQKGEKEQAKVILTTLEKDEDTPSAMKERVAQVKAGL